MQLPENILTTVRREACREGQRNFFVYDTAPMREKIANLKSIMPEGVEIFYAMKANPHSAFLKAAKESGVTGVEIASLGEAEKARLAGFAASQMIYTGPGKSPEELRWSAAHGIHTVHVESLTEAHRLNQICKEMGKAQDILLRINPDFEIHGAQKMLSGGSSKFGIDTEKLPDILPKILELQNLRFRGLHVYAATGILKVDDLLKNCELVFSLTQQIEAGFQGVKCDIVDFGGGFGIDYLETGQDFSLTSYADGLHKLIAQYKLHGRHFMLELGRYLAADSGWYCTEILDIKDSRGKKQIVTAGGTNHFRRPAALSINHPVVIVPMKRPALFAGQEHVAKEKVYIGGPICSSADKIASDVYIEEAHIGDIAVLCLAGAYGLTMSHLEFLSHKRPPEIVLG
ncbi:MAG: diaminopimelate decarboxylase [Alphaproteobacteria bacterium]|nr:diaminopimelate decarboxylase [Alphaproteobacteria bacterium]